MPLPLAGLDSLQGGRLWRDSALQEDTAAVTGRDGTHHALGEADTRDRHDAAVMEHALSLGLQMPDDDDLLWIAEERAAAPLPEGWAMQATGAGDTYYRCGETGVSTWDNPLDEAYRRVVDKHRAGRVGGAFFARNEDPLMQTLFEGRPKSSCGNRPTSYSTDCDVLQISTASEGASGLPNFESFEHPRDDEGLPDTLAQALSHAAAKKDLKERHQELQDRARETLCLRPTEKAHPPAAAGGAGGARPALSPIVLGRVRPSPLSTCDPSSPCNMLSPASALAVTPPSALRRAQPHNATALLNRAAAWASAGSSAAEEDTPTPTPSAPSAPGEGVGAEATRRRIRGAVEREKELAEESLRLELQSLQLHHADFAREAEAALEAEKARLRDAHDADLREAEEDEGTARATLRAEFKKEARRWEGRLRDDGDRTRRTASATIEAGLAAWQAQHDAIAAAQRTLLEAVLEEGQARLDIEQQHAEHAAAARGVLLSSISEALRREGADVGTTCLALQQRLLEAEAAGAEESCGVPICPGVPSPPSEEDDEVLYGLRDAQQQHRTEDMAELEGLLREEIGGVALARLRELHGVAAEVRSGLLEAAAAWGGRPREADAAEGAILSSIARKEAELRAAEGEIHAAHARVADVLQQGAAELHASRQREVEAEVAAEAHGQRMREVRQRHEAEAGSLQGALPMRLRQQEQHVRVLLAWGVEERSAVTREEACERLALKREHLAGIAQRCYAEEVRLRESAHDALVQCVEAMPLPASSPLMSSRTYTGGAAGPAPAASRTSVGSQTQAGGEASAVGVLAAVAPPVLSPGVRRGGGGGGGAVSGMGGSGGAVVSQGGSGEPLEEKERLASEKRLVKARRRVVQAQLAEVAELRRCSAGMSERAQRGLAQQESALLQESEQVRLDEVALQRDIARYNARLQLARETRGSEGGLSDVHVKKRLRKRVHQPGHARRC